MKPRRHALWSMTALLACLWATPALQAIAATGQVDSFGASATTVRLGETVDFAVSYTIVPIDYSNGGSDPHEPAPQDGYQEWHVNWYSFERETVTSVWLQAGGASFASSASGAPGSAYSGTWSFQLTFDQVGRHDIVLSGGFATDVHSYSSNESAYRNCWNNDPGGTDELFCDSWQWQYQDYDETYGSDGVFNSVAVAIDVIAPAVPEPPSAWLALAGVAALLAWRRGRRG